MGKNKNVGCGCDYCMTRGVRRDFRHDHGSDGWEETPYRSKKKKGCKKTKTGKPCDFTVRVVKYTSTPKAKVILAGTQWEETRRYVIEYYTMSCSRCGKHNWNSYRSIHKYI
jgi:hypothetical protein